MNEYSVSFSRKAESDLFRLLEDSERFGYQQTLTYVEGLERFCRGLASMPNRFSEVRINEYQLRFFPYKAHEIYYSVNEKTKEVFIVTILHGYQLAENHINDLSDPEG